MPHDYSTIRLDRLPIAKVARTYHVSEQMGQGCICDAPGFPSYFLRSVYTGHGNVPRRGPVTVIRDANGDDREVSRGEDDTWSEKGRAQFERKIRSLWIPLPFDHPRVQAWVRYLYGYFRESYVGPSGSRKVADLIRAGAPVDHAAHRVVTDFYPDATPATDLIKSPPAYGAGGPGDWWERHAERPTPETCPGDHIGGHRAHPTSGTWCQMCGWRE